jgi:uncharacterized membrane protein YkvA (DUF1232 family)
VSDRAKLERLAHDATAKGKAERKGPLDKISVQFTALVRLVVAYARGQYRDVSSQSIVLAIAGLIYLVSPIDLIPDFLPGGYIDDVAVLGWVIRSINEELNAFIAWENGGSSA